MKETDVDFAQPDGQVEGKVDGIAGGIMDLIDNPDPDSSGVVEVQKETVSTPPVTEVETTEEKQDVFKIKWQGQEKELSEEEIIDLAQKGFDYTQKTQALALERDQLAPYQGLANRIKADPALAQKIAVLLSGQPQEEAKKFDDPIEQLKWETKQETMAEIRKELQQTLTPLHRQQALTQVRMQVQTDPDYREVHEKIIQMVQSQPPALQKNLYMQLDQDPNAYLQAFQFFKQQKSQVVTPLEQPKPIKKETRAPILESGGVAPLEGVEAKDKVQRLSKQKARALRTGDNDALASWLQESGALEHLY